MSKPTSSMTLLNVCIDAPLRFGAYWIHFSLQIDTNITYILRCLAMWGDLHAQSTPILTRFRPTVSWSSEPTVRLPPPPVHVLSPFCSSDTKYTYLPHLTSLSLPDAPDTPTERKSTKERLVLTRLP